MIVELGAVGDVLFVSADGGTTWQARGPVPGSAVLDLDVNPTDPGELWLGADNGLYVSRNGGATFAAVDEFVGQATGPIDVFQRDGPSRLLAFHPRSGFGQLSEDGGQTWARVDQPGPPDSIASGGSPESIALAAATGVYAYSPAIFGWIDLQAPVDMIQDLHGVPGDRGAILGHTARRIAIYNGRLDSSLRVPNEVAEIPHLSLLEGTTPPVRRRSQLLPASSRLKMEVGESRTVTYELELPATLTPIDLVFMVDTSSSMSKFIDEATYVIAGIHNGLVQSGAAVYFGLVDYRSYPDVVPPRLDTENYVYRRVLDVGASTSEMEGAIKDLVGEGGGVYDAQLEALWQLATGEGKDVWPPGPSSRDVPPGWQANFRKKALRIVVHVGDEPFGSETSTRDGDGAGGSPQDRVARPDIPDFDEVAREFRHRVIKHVGLSLYDAGTPDLRRMAKATETFAPRGGADCDGDGTADIAAGDPLVCRVRTNEVRAGDMTSSILGLVAALRSTADVGLQVEGPGEAVQSIAPSRYRDVVLAARGSLPFEVTYTCSRAMAGAETKVRLVASGVLSAPPVARATVACGDVGTGPEPAAIVPVSVSAPGAAPLLTLRPPPPPGAPPTATNVQGHAQPNLGFVTQEQEQEQPQLALVYQVDPEADWGSDEAYAFVVPTREEPAPALPLAGAATLMSIAYGVATRLRHRTQSQR